MRALPLVIGNYNRCKDPQNPHGAITITMTITNGTETMNATFGSSHGPRDDGSRFGSH